jgi:hypothetical protein
MRELIVIQNITLDGVIDAAEGWFEPAGEEGSTSRTSSPRSASRAPAATRCWWGA